MVPNRLRRRSSILWHPVQP